MFTFEVEVTEHYLNGGAKRYNEWVTLMDWSLEEATDHLFIKYIKKNSYCKHHQIKIVSTSLPN